MKYLAFFLGLGIATSVAAAPGERWYLGVGASVLQPNEARQQDVDQAGAGLWLGWPLPSYPGFHAELAVFGQSLVTKADRESRRRGHLSLDVLRSWSLSQQWIPYLLVGIGASQEELGSDDKLNASLSLGGGLRWRPTHSPLALRLDTRAMAQENEFRPTHPSGRRVLVDGRVSLGLEWHLRGAQPQAPKQPAPALRTPALADPDVDSDGVDEPRDQCPGTPSGEPVDSHGCRARNAG